MSLSTNPTASHRSSNSQNNGGSSWRCMSRGKACVAVSLVVPLLILWVTDLQWIVLPRSVRVASSTTSLLKNVSIAQEFLNSELMLSPECLDKEHLLGLLYRAGLRGLTTADCERLPTWRDVADLYGEQPLIHGLDTCQAYRELLNGREPDIRVAGLYNTGTTGFAEMLQRNYRRKDDLLDHMVPWGKHLSLEYKQRWEQDTGNQSSEALVFPVTIIRDPLRWMLSMCKAGSKTVEWMRGVDNHCPNLVPNEDEQHLNRYQGLETFQVTVKGDYVEHYASLADMWSQWYRSYLNSDIPGLVIRFEDTLFHPEQVMASILNCIGRPMSEPFKFRSEESDGIGNTAEFTAALAKYGRDDGRDEGLAPADRVYIQTALDPEIMHKFHYRQVSVDRPRAPSNQGDNKSGKLVLTEAEAYDIAVTLSHDHVECEGKEHLLAILSRAGKGDLSVQDCRELPEWDEVSRLYGKEPVIIGLETCEEYRSQLKQHGLEPDPRVAGLFNTGTNAFAESLMLNFKMQDILDYNTPGGKHTNLKNKFMDSNRTLGVLPIALIRDPYRWMISMCKSPYKARWSKGLGEHCPNLVPNEEELTTNVYLGIETFEVTVDRDYNERYDSLADMWSEYYDQYMQAGFPRLIIRFEDTLYHAERVMELVTECIGAPMQEPFKYHLDASKEHGNPADFATALAKYGSAEGRAGGMSELDKEYAAVALNEHLMKTFRYPLLPVVERKSLTTGDINNKVTQLVTSHVECQGKERLLEILVRAGMADLLDENLICTDLPTWDEVSSLYGDEPVIFGQESCQRYRDKLAAGQEAGLDVRPDPRVGGLFNTGTNAFATTLIRNYRHQHILQYNAPGGKHKLLSQKTQATNSSSYALPVILIRDPYRWMNSMCKARYKARWSKGDAGHCPNLVPSPSERESNKQYRSIDTFEVDVLQVSKEHYKSLADMWTDWYREWVETSIPSLVIRFEDTLFHAEKVMQAVMECIGEPMPKPFLYQLDAAKSHGASADFLTAMAKYGGAKGREGGMLLDDKVYAKDALDPRLLDIFHYKHLPS